CARSHHCTPLFISLHPRPPSSPLFPYTTLFRSEKAAMSRLSTMWARITLQWVVACALVVPTSDASALDRERSLHQLHHTAWRARSEEHTSELQSRENLVCRLLLEKKNEHV